MKEHGLAYVVRRAPLGVAIAALIGAVSVGAQSRAPQEPPQQPRAGMMGQQQGRMAEMAAAEQKLTDLLATMNAARGDERIEAIAAVVNELAARHIAMRRQMMGMMKGPTVAAPEKPADDGGHSQHHPQR